MTIRYRLNVFAMVPVVVVFVVLRAGAGEVVKVGTYDNEPKVFMDTSGKPRGIFVDIINEVASREGWELQYVPGTWEENLKRLAAGEIDIMPDVAYSEERALKYEYSKEAVLSDWFQVFRHKDINVSSILDLEGKRVVVLKDSIQHEILHKILSGFMITCETVEVESYNDAFKMLNRREADAVISNRFIVKSKALQESLAKTGIVFFPTHLHYAAPKGRTAVLASIDKHLARMKKQPGSAYFQAMERWLGDAPVKVLPDYVKYIGAAAAAIILLVAIMTVLLKFQVNRRTRELREKAGALEKTLEELQRTRREALRLEKLQALGQMASGVAHDFNNILTPIIGYAEMLLKKKDVFKDEKRATKYVRIIKRAGMDGAAIIKRMKEFYRMHEEACPEMISAVKIMMEVVELTRPRWETQAAVRGVFIKMNTDLKPVSPIHGTKHEVREVLMNLVFNAIDAMPEGGEITLGTASDNGLVVLSVGDTGEGMDKDTRDNCLRPFFSTKGKDGTGLGLAMAAGIAESHAGAIEIESEPGEGTTIFLKFPAARTTGQHEADEVPSVEHTLSILAVDDDERCLETLALLLREDGHTVDTATDPEAGLRMALEGSYDLVIADRAMPGMSGDQLIRKLKEKDVKSTMFLCTGSNDIIESDGDGKETVLRKPLTTQMLRLAVEEVNTSGVDRQ